MSPLWATKKGRREREAPSTIMTIDFSPQGSCRRDSLNLIACSIDGIYHINK